MKTFCVLQTVQWGMTHFGAVCTGGSLRLRDIRREIAAGYVADIGPVEMCDDDGFTITPSRFRTGYVLTTDGTKALAEMLVKRDEERKKEIERQRAENEFIVTGAARASQGEGSAP